MNEAQPKVTIVIPVFNGAKLLGEAIESSLAQTHTNLEVIVVNDGSRDDGRTERVAERYASRVRYIHKENEGVASALNTGIKNATGEYISWLSHDDLYYSTKIATQIEFLRRERYPNKVLYYTDFEYIDEVGMVIATYRLEHLRPEEFIYSLFSGGVLHGCSLLIPRVCFGDVGLFNQDLFTTQDYEYWFRSLKKGYVFKHIPRVLVRGRIHSNQTQRNVPFIYHIEREELFKWAIDHFLEQETVIDLGRVADALLSGGLVSASEYATRQLRRRTVIKRKTAGYIFPRLTIPAAEK